MIELTNVEVSHIDTLGLVHLHNVHDIKVNHGHLTILVEHFHSEINMFHLPLSDMTMMLMDI